MIICTAGAWQGNDFRDLNSPINSVVLILRCKYIFVRQLYFNNMYNIYKYISATLKAISKF